MKGIDKALAVAHEQGSAAIAKVLEASLVPLSAALVEQGIRLSDRGKKRGRKPCGRVASVV